MLAYIVDYISSLAGQYTVQRPAPPLLPFPQPQSVQEARENVVHICRRALGCGARVAAAHGHDTLVRGRVHGDPFQYLARSLQLHMRSLVCVCSAIIVEMDTDPYVGFAAFTDPIQQLQHAFISFELTEADMYKSHTSAVGMSYALYDKILAIEKRLEAARALLYSTYRDLKPAGPFPDLLEIEEYLACPALLSQINAKGLLES